MEKITFNSPVFICKTHQKVFFSRLREIPAYNSVIGTDSTTYLLLNEPIDEQSVAELKNIFDHWAIDSSPLANLF